MNIHINVYKYFYNSNMKNSMLEIREGKVPVSVILLRRKLFFKEIFGFYLKQTPFACKIPQQI